MSLLSSHRWSRRAMAALSVTFLVLLVLATTLDRPLAQWAANLPPGMVEAGRIVSYFGLSGYMFAVSAAIALGAYLLRRSPARAAAWHRLTLVLHRAVYFFTCIAVSGLLAQVIKHIVGRSRPRFLLQAGPFDFHPLSWKNATASFPSGHTTSAFAAAMALGLMFPRARPALLLAALAIAISRVVAGQHYPSDLVGGAALGALVSFQLAQVFARRSIAFETVDSPVPNASDTTVAGSTGPTR